MQAKLEREKERGRAGLDMNIFYLYKNTIGIGKPRTGLPIENSIY